MRPVIIVFAKAPRAGHAKTRLVPAVTPSQAAQLHDAFVRDTIRNLLDLNAADVELHTDMETDAWRDLEVPRHLQHEGDLGLKMFHALANALADGRPQVVILGSDAPDLPAAHITSLLASNADIALGPAPDGGYYAIAARRVHPLMFHHVTWSSGEERAQTLHACAAQGLSLTCAASWSDIDTPADLERLIGSERAPESALALKRVRSA